MKMNDCFKQRLLKTIPPDVASSTRSLDVSRKRIEEAEACMVSKIYWIVIVTSYTAMFHAAKALLFRDGVKERSHECVPIYIREKYPELERYADVLNSYRLIRHNALYGLDFEAGEEDAKAAIEHAKAFLDGIKHQLSL